MSQPLVKIGTENDEYPPLIIEHPEFYVHTFSPEERAQWREATDEEYQRYVDYYNQHEQ